MYAFTGNNALLETSPENDGIIFTIRKCWECGSIRKRKLPGKISLVSSQLIRITQQPLNIKACWEAQKNNLGRGCRRRIFRISHF